MKNKLFLILFTSLIFFLAIVFYCYLLYEKKSRADLSNIIIDTSQMKDISLVKTKNVNNFSLYRTPGSPVNGFKFNSNSPSLGIKAFTGKDIAVQDGNQLNTYLSSDTINQLSLIDKQVDSQSGEFSFNENISGSQHFYYQQKIDNIPVYGSSVNLHLDSNNQIYGFDGNVTSSSQLPTQVIEEEKAQEIALNKAKEETKGAISLYIYQSEKYIINKKLLGISEDDNNYLTLAVWIRSENNSPTLFSKKYFVDFVSGQIVYEEEQIFEALNRQIKQCNNNTCQTVRSEGQAATSDNTVNKTYDILGETYNFYYNSFSRDSYDGNGSPIISVVHLQDSTCPNAYSDPVTKWIFLCNGMETQDIITHEFTHLISHNRLLYQYQSGSMNESVSDIFATGVDTDDWSMGEGSSFGLARYLDDPPRKNQPDRLFSDLYYCGTADTGGVHRNSGILSKAFYLMVEGGSFNSCSIVGIGKDKAHKIIYRALTIYVTPTANFKNMFDAINHACNDLYSPNSTDCLSVNGAMEAVEMDQQPAGTQINPKCSSQSGQPASCVIIDTPTPTITVTPTSLPSVTVSPISPSPTSSLEPTVVITPSGNVKINLKLRFQGIEKKPAEDLNSLAVKITVVDKEGNKQENYGQFSADDQGIWSGSVYFNLQNPANNQYKLLIKGPRHIQKRACDGQPTEEKAGFYHCDVPNILLKPGDNQFDFSTIVLLAGDLPIQDGIVNSYDLSLVRERLGLVAYQGNLADINLDGVINTQDYSLIIYSLSTRFDE